MNTGWIKNLFWVPLVLVACTTTGEKEPIEKSQPVAVEKKAPLDPVPVDVAAQSMGINPDIPEDPEIVALLAPRAETVRAAASKVVGELKTPLTRGKPESTMGNFVTDAMRQSVEASTGKKADICFTNMGGLRRDLPPGSITAGMVTELMPFDNSVVVFVLSGKDLKVMMERLSQRGDAISGARYTRQGDRLHEVIVGGRALDEKSDYRICTNDYIFDGGGNYPLEPAREVNTTGVLLRDAIRETFESAFSRKEGISGKLEGRATWGDPR
jgi:2',3'-cyclic-nucleotide 2'-phosphodiesterase (5'-nucleotidase family)